MCSSVRAAAPSRASCSAALRDAGQSETNIVELGWALGRRMTGALNGTLTLGGVVDDGNYTDSGTQVCDSGESIMIRVLHWGFAFGKSPSLVLCDCRCHCVSMNPLDV